MKIKKFVKYFIKKTIRKGNKNMLNNIKSGTVKKDTDLHKKTSPFTCFCVSDDIFIRDFRAVDNVVNKAKLFYFIIFHFFFVF